MAESEYDQIQKVPPQLDLSQLGSVKLKKRKTTQKKRKYGLFENEEACNACMRNIFDTKTFIPRFKPKIDENFRLKTPQGIVMTLGPADDNGFVHATLEENNEQITVHKDDCVFLGVDSPQDAEHILTLVSHGFPYGRSKYDTRTIPGNVGLYRRVLSLNEPLPKSMRNKRRQCVKIIRENPQLELKINATSVLEICRRIQNHHKNQKLYTSSDPGSWTTDEMARSLQFLCDKNQCTIFELWNADKLIAGEFGHCLGGYYYSASRFFDRSARDLQPGFIMTFSMLQVMKESGIELWDLGPASSVGMMTYKKSISMQVPVEKFLNMLQKMKDLDSNLPTALSLSPIFDEHLIGWKPKESKHIGNSFRPTADMDEQSLFRQGEWENKFSTFDKIGFPLTGTDGKPIPKRLRRRLQRIRKGYLKKKSKILTR